jgi:hypothetical protein
VGAGAPFRHLIVYPPMIQEIGRNWRARAGSDYSSPQRAARLSDRKDEPGRATTGANLLATRAAPSCSAP